MINLQLSSSIHFHGVLNELCAERGTGTAILRETMLQHIIAMRETVLHVIFLELGKAYYAPDRELCLDILAGYGVGPRTILILQTLWARIQMAEKVGGHYGPAFQSHCGVTQGNPLPHMIFNMVVESTVGH